MGKYKDALDSAKLWKPYCASVTSEPKKKLSSYLDSQIYGKVKIPKEKRQNVHERVIQSRIIKMVQKRGGFCLKYFPVKVVNKDADTAAIVGNQTGTPDLIICYKGLFVAIEVKTPRRSSFRVKGEQLAQLSRIRLAQGLSFLAYSVQQAEQILDHIDVTLSRQTSVCEILQAPTADRFLDARLEIKRQKTG